MTERSKDWNEGLAEDLKDPEFACEFIISALEEDIPLQVALGKVIRALGIKEFSEKTGIPSPDIDRALSLVHNPFPETLNHLLKTLGLRISVTQLNR